MRECWIKSDVERVERINKPNGIKYVDNYRYQLGTNKEHKSTKILLNKSKIFVNLDFY